MITTEQVRSLSGRDVIGADGQSIGSVGEVYLDDTTGRPEWLTVRSGLFGTKQHFVPLREATLADDGVRVPYDKDLVKNAPGIEADGHLDPDEERQLYRHYGIAWAETASGEQTAGVQAAAGTPAAGTPGDTAAGGGTGREVGADDAMTRSEEQVRVDTERQQAGTARLRKWVETEQVDVPVEVKREKAVLETEPITEENRDQALSGPDISEAEHEVTLTEERPVVEKETVPVERVRLGTVTETDTEHVSEEVRKERIDAEGDVEGRR